MQTNIRDSYKAFYKKLDEPKATFKDYLDIVHGFIKFMMKKVMEGEDVVFPRIGTFSIRGKRNQAFIGTDGEIKGLAPNWKETKELWDKDIKAKENRLIIYCSNEESNGVTYSFKWDNTTLPLKNKQYYKVRLSRENKREIVKRVKSRQPYLILERKFRKQDNLIKNGNN